MQERTTREIDGLEGPMVNRADTQGSKKKPEKPFGHTDWVLPTVLGVLFFGGMSLAMITVGDNTVPMGTVLAFAVVVAWLLIGIFIGLVTPFLIFFGAVKIGPLNRFFGMTAAILTGLAYFILSGMIMAHASIPI